MITEENIKLLQNIEFAFCLDFFTEISRKKVATYFMNATNLKATYCDTYTKPGSTNINVCRNDFGGSKMCQVQTKFYPYFEAINLAYKLFDVIDTYGFTNSKCKAVVSVKINSKELNIPNIANINIFKLICAIDNLSQIQKMYKNQHEKMYLNSLLYVYPKNMFVNDANQFISYKNFDYPNNSKFNLFSKDIKSNMVTVQYSLHKDYQKNKRTFYSYLNSLALSVVGVLRNNYSYTEEEENKVKRVLILQKNVLNSIDTLEAFKLNYPKIELLADLKTEDDVIKTYYNILRDKLFELICYCGLDSGSVNYDPDRNIVQVRDAVITNGNNVSGVEFFYSHINGNFKNCKFFECEISDSIIRDCELFYGNSIKRCEVYNTQFHGVDNSLLGSFVSNPLDKLIEADVSKSIIKGTLNLISSIDKESEILK